MEQARCKRCGGQTFYQIRRKKLRCKSCLYEFSPYLIKTFRLTTTDWKAITEYFLLERSGWFIAQQLNLSAPTVYKALKLIRQDLPKDVPPVFSGTVEVDETYLGGQWQNKRKAQKEKEPQSKRGKGTTKQPVFGILCRDSYVFAEVVPDIEAANLVPIIEKKVKVGSTVCSDTWGDRAGNQRLPAPDS